MQGNYDEIRKANRESRSKASQSGSQNHRISHTAVCRFCVLFSKTKA